MVKQKTKNPNSISKIRNQKSEIIIVGLGNVGRRLLELMDKKREWLAARYGLHFVVVGVADSAGAKKRETARGFDLRELIETKRRGEKIGSAKLDAWALLQETDADLLVELTPTNLPALASPPPKIGGPGKTGEPGLSLIRAALKRKMNVVTANKGPLVLEYEELMASARKNNVKLYHSATVTGGLPTLNIGRRDLAPCEIIGFEGIVNATTNYILTRMGEGDSFDAALKHAQEVGHAEADPTLDIDGWDAANKLVIIANAVLHRPTKLSEVQVIGIRGITQKKMRDAKASGQVIKLVARADKLGSDFRFSVKPIHLALEHPLARVGADMMGVIYHTDINGTITATIEERDPYPTAAAVLRDMVAVYS